MANQWVCAFCFRWNVPSNQYCYHCGRDIEFPQWSRKPKSQKKDDDDAE